MSNEDDLINTILLDTQENKDNGKQHNLNLEICDEYNHDEANETYDWNFNDISLHNNLNENEEEISLDDLVASDDIKIKTNYNVFPHNTNQDVWSNEGESSNSDSESEESDNESIYNVNPKLINKISSKELNSDLEMFQSLVKNQNETRINMLKRVLYSYLKQYILKPLDIKPVLTKRFIDKVVEMSEVLDLENMLGAIIGDILLNTKSLNALLITKYSNIIGAFLSTYNSQDNFLNQLLIIINNNQNLIDDEKIIEIFIACVTNRLVSRSMLKNWSQKITEDNAEKLAYELNIDIMFIKMVDSILNN